jgi:polyhydroxyalkanoate synthesis regulator phasin
VRDEIRRMALVTSGIVELTRNRAESIVRDLISSGDLPGGQAGQTVKELMERSRQNPREIMNLVRGEIRGQIEALGVATKRDIERLERRVARLEDRPSAPTTRKTSKKTAKKASKKTAKKTSKKTAKKTSKKTAKKTSKKTTERGPVSAEPSSMPTPENPPAQRPQGR